MTDKERLNELRNGTSFESDDIDFLLEKANLYFLLRDENTLIKQFNREYRKTIESMQSEIKYALHSNKSEDVKEHYLKNAERFADEVLRRG